jgi:hypothetical protein
MPRVQRAARLAGLILVAVLALGAVASAGAFDGRADPGVIAHGGGGGGGGMPPCGYGPCPATPTPTPTETATPTPTPTATATPTPISEATKDTQPPKSSVRPAGKALRLKQALAKGLPFSFTCDEACSVRVTLTVDKATARKLGLDKKAKGPVVVASGSATRLTAGGATVRARFSAKAKKALKRARTLKLRAGAAASDAAGNSTPVSVASVRLKR